MKRLLAAVARDSVASLSLCAEGGDRVAQAKTAGRVIESLTLHLDLAGMKAAKAPRVIEGELVLSASGPYRSVAAAFAHEGFATLTPTSATGRESSSSPIPFPSNGPSGTSNTASSSTECGPSIPPIPRRRSDPATGLELSVARVPYLSDLHLGAIRILGDDGRTARFLFRGASGESVTVCGDFDNWDPFIHEMSETSPGLYSSTCPCRRAGTTMPSSIAARSCPIPSIPTRRPNADGQDRLGPDRARAAE